MRLVTLCTLLASAAAPCASSAAAAQGMTPYGTAPQRFATVQPMTDADLLTDQLRALSANPRDLWALTRAAELSTRLGDLNAAMAFVARGEAIDARSPRLKAIRGAILVRLERPGEALRLFAEAAALGADSGASASDRALAYDLIGQQERAQRDYRLALRREVDDETRRRYALSLGISGRRDEALAQIDPLLRQSDRGAWRVRAFILAMAGDISGADRIASSMMPAGMAAGLRPFLQRLPALSPADRAFAVHFGEVRSTPSRLADARMTPPLGTLGPEQGVAPTRIAAVQPPRQLSRADQKRADREAKRAEREARRTGRTALASLRPTPATPPLPPPPGPPVQLADNAFRPPAPYAAAPRANVPLPAPSSPGRPAQLLPSPYRLPQASGASAMGGIAPVPSAPAAVRGGAIPASSTSRDVRTSPSAVGAMARGGLAEAAVPMPPARPAPISPAPSGGSVLASIAPSPTSATPLATSPVQAATIASGAPVAGSATAGTPAAASTFVAPSQLGTPAVSGAATGAGASPAGGSAAAPPPAGASVTSATAPAIPAASVGPAASAAPAQVAGISATAITPRTAIAAPVAGAVPVPAAPSPALVDRTPAASGSEVAPVLAGAAAPSGTPSGPPAAPGFTPAAGAWQAQAPVASPAPVVVATAAPLTASTASPAMDTRAASAATPTGAPGVASGPLAASAQAAAGPPREIAGPPAPPAMAREAAREDPLAAIVGSIAIPGAELGVLPPRSVPEPVDPPVPAPAAASRAESAATTAEPPVRPTPRPTVAKPTPLKQAAAKELAAGKPAADKPADKKTAKPGESKAEGTPATDKKKAAEDKKLADKKAADKLAADKKAADKKLADKKAAAKPDPAKGEPARYWVQVAGGANADDLDKAWVKVRDKAPDVLRGRQAWRTPLRATNRLLTGPFKTGAEAQEFVNRLAKAGLSGFSFQSAAGQKVEKLAAR